MIITRENHARLCAIVELYSEQLGLLIYLLYIGIYIYWFTYFIYVCVCVCVCVCVRARVCACVCVQMVLPYNNVIE